VGASQAELKVSACPGCGLELPDSGDPGHAYLRASPACWALFGEVLAREYLDPAYFAVHQLTVDAYAAQHPGTGEPRAIRSTALHLMTLCLFLERGRDPREGPKLHKRLVRSVREEPLEVPAPIGTLTVATVREAAGPSEHEAAVRAWAADVWLAWAPHHPTVRGWLDGAFGVRAADRPRNRR
jgi:hypothetical protein